MKIILFIFIVCGLTTPPEVKIIEPSGCQYRGFSRFDHFKITLMYQPSVCIHKIHKAQKHCNVELVDHDQWQITRLQPFLLERIPGQDVISLLMILGLFGTSLLQNKIIFHILQF